MSSSELKTCPRCGNAADRFMDIEAGMRLALEQGEEGAALPNSVCAACYETLSATVSQGLKLRMERDMREKNKMMAWKNRVHLIKNARTMMNQRAYSEAAVQYEKYLRVLEVVYNLQKGQLSPAVFNNSSRSKELTVIASVYWDLMRIYDTNPRYGARMQQAANQLADFLRFSPIYPDIVKKAEQFARGAKNPAVMRAFLRQVRRTRGPCFIATAAFADTPDAMEVRWLRQWRDRRLRPYWLGRQVIWAYYQISPALARELRRRPHVAQSVRWALIKISDVMKKNLNS